MHHRDRDHILKPFQRAHDQRTVSPRAGETDVEMVAPRFDLETAYAARAGATVGSNPVAEGRILAHEAATGRLGVVPDVAPLTFDQQSHISLLDVLFGRVWPVQRLIPADLQRDSDSSDCRGQRQNAHNELEAPSPN